MLGSTIKITDKATIKAIEKYQKAYKVRHGKHISKANIIALMCTFGSEKLSERATEMLKEAKIYNK